MDTVLRLIIKHKHIDKNNNTCTKSGVAYTKTMSVFPRSQPALAPRSKAATQAALLYAVILVVMALGQLFTFEKFLDLMVSFQLPFGTGSAYTVASLLVACEVFAVPFLLRMQLSPAFRVFSMVLGWVAAVLWLGMTFWLVLTSHAATTVGFLGSVGDLTPGWWAVFVSLSYGILAAWASWGLWPFARKVTTAKK